VEAALQEKLNDSFLWAVSQLARRKRKDAGGSIQQVERGRGGLEDGRRSEKLESKTSCQGWLATRGVGAY